MVCDFCAPDVHRACTAHAKMADAVLRPPKCGTVGVGWLFADRRSCVSGWCGVKRDR